jgi:hypothetical protein
MFGSIHCISEFTTRGGGPAALRLTMGRAIGMISCCPNPRADPRGFREIERSIGTGPAAMAAASSTLLGIGAGLAISNDSHRTALRRHDRPHPACLPEQ